MSDEDLTPKPKKPRAKKPPLSDEAGAAKPRVRKAAPRVTAKATSASPALVEAAKPRFPMQLVAFVAFGILILDQLLKYVVVHVLRLDRIRELDLIDPWLNLRMAWNQGVNFGLFSSDVNLMRWVLIAIAFAVCGWVWIWLSRTPHSKLAQISAGLLIGGALGNVIDRLTYGAVADFLNMSLPNWRNPYSFNVADIAIFAGALGLFLQPPTKKDEPAEVRKPAARVTKPRDKTRDDAGK